MSGRWLAFLLLVPGIANATVPDAMRAGDFWEDQWAAARWGLPPHVWSIVLAAVAVALTAAFAWRASRSPASEPPQELPDLPPDRHRKWLAVAIGALVLFYSPGLLGDFGIYDDPKNLWQDPVVSNLTWENLRIVLFENHRGWNQEWMYLSLQLTYAVAGRTYWPYYATNLAMLPILLYLVHEVALLLMRSRRIALLTTAFFGLSPILAELMCWMLARGHYFGLLFALASCVSYLRYLEVRDVAGSARWRYLALSVLAFGSSQLGKPIFLFIPGWLLLFDVWRGRRDLARVAAEKLPFVPVSLLFLWKMIEGSGKLGRVEEEFLGGTLSNTLALDTNLLLEYFRSAFVPYQTGPFVPWNEPASWLHVTGVPDVLVHGFSPVASLVLLGCLFACAVVLARSYGWPVLLFALVGSMISYATVLNLPAHTTVAAYRYTLSTKVLVSIVFATATVHGMAALGPFPAGLRRAVPAIAAGWLALASFHSNANRAAWADPVTLWTRSADVLYPHDGWSHYFAGKALQQDKHWESCVAHLARAHELMPQYPYVERRLGDCAYAAKQPELAAQHWERYFRKNRKEIDAKYAKKLRDVGLGKLVPAGVE
jgi:hypothetical protein